MCCECERAAEREFEFDGYESEELDVQSAVEILATIRASIMQGQRSSYTDDIIEAVDCLYLDIVESMEMN